MRTTILLAGWVIAGQFSVAIPPPLMVIAVFLCMAQDVKEVLR